MPIVPEENDDAIICLKNYKAPGEYLLAGEAGDGSRVDRLETCGPAVPVQKRWPKERQ